jgi:hypothetical protein
LAVTNIVLKYIVQKHDIYLYFKVRCLFAQSSLITGLRPSMRVDWQTSSRFKKTSLITYYSVLTEYMYIHTYIHIDYIYYINIVLKYIVQKHDIYLYFKVRCLFVCLMVLSATFNTNYHSFIQYLSRRKFKVINVISTHQRFYGLHKSYWGAKS